LETLEKQFVEDLGLVSVPSARYMMIKYAAATGASNNMDVDAVSQA
jgi:hypothetical protein